MDYSKMKIADLKEMASAKGLRNVTGMKKAELVELLQNVDKMIYRPVETVKTESDEQNKNDRQEDTEKDAVKDAEKEKNGTSFTRREAKQETPGNTSEGKEEEQRGRRTAERSVVDRRRDKESQRAGRSNLSNRSNGQGVRISQSSGMSRRSAEGRQDRQAGRQSEHQTAGQMDRQTARRVENMSERQTGETEAVKETERSSRIDSEPPVETPVVKEVQSAAESGGYRMMYDGQEYDSRLNSGEMAKGILEVMADGYGFLRSENYMSGDKDIYISPFQIRKYGLRTGDIVSGPIKKRTQNEKFCGLLFLDQVNGMFPSQVIGRKKFENLTPIFPEDRIGLDYDQAPISLRIVDLFSPIGKGQRGMIVSPPKAGKTTLLKQIAKRINTAYKDVSLLVLLIDERPEEVTDIKESIEGRNAEVIYSTFDELPEHHKRVSEMVIERAKRLVESGKDVVILLDSITRLARAYNLTVTPSGRTLSGGLDPAALHMPKKFFGAARNMREGGSLTILATALIETGSRLDDVVFEEFKGTGNMELILDRGLSERRVFPAIDIPRSGTRRDDLLLLPDEKEALDLLHKEMRGPKVEEFTEELIRLFKNTKNNKELVQYVLKKYRSKK